MYYWIIQPSAVWSYYRPTKPKTKLINVSPNTLIYIKTRNAFIYCCCQSLPLDTKPTARPTQMVLLLTHSLRFRWLVGQIEQEYVPAVSFVYFYSTFTERNQKWQMRATYVQPNVRCLTFFLCINLFTQYIVNMFIYLLFFRPVLTAYQWAKSKFLEGPPCAEAVRVGLYIFVMDCRQSVKGLKLIPMRSLRKENRQG